MKRYYKWSLKNGEYGRFMIESNSGTLKYTHVSGSAPRDDMVLYVILANIDFAKKAIEKERTCPWKRQVYHGMSGCTDWYIQYYCERNSSIMRNHVWHSSMRDKANMNMEIYVKDIFDIFSDTKCISMVKKCWSKGMTDEVDIAKEILQHEEFQDEFHDLVLYRDHNYETLVSEFESSDKGKEFYYDFPDSDSMGEGEPDPDYSKPSPDDQVDEDLLYK